MYCGNAQVPLADGVPRKGVDPDGLEWCCHLYRRQMERGGRFLHEFMFMPRHELVERIRADRCRSAQDAEDGGPVNKPTGFMSNSPMLLEVVNRRCFGRNGLCTRPQGGKHTQCLGKVAQREAVLQEELCATILRGFAADLRRANARW